MSNAPRRWQRPGSDAPAPTRAADAGPPKSNRLEDLAPGRPERRVPGWLVPVAALLLGVLATLGVVAGSGVFDTGPLESDVVAAYNDGFAEGSSETRAELEADFIARANSVTAEQIREAELAAIRGVAAEFLEQRGMHFNEGYTVGYAEGYREAQRRALDEEQAAAEASVSDASAES